MNLKDLNAISSKLNTKRQKTGGDACQKAYALLAEASINEFKYKSLLKQAISLFSEAIRFNRSSTKAYIGMGYLLLLLNDYSQAEIYLMTALRLDRENTETLALLEALQVRKFAHTKGSVVSQPGEIDTPMDDWDALYDRVDEKLTHLINNTQSLSSLGPSQEKKDLESYKETLAKLELKQEQLNPDIAHLDTEFETHELKLKSQEVTLHLRQFKQLILMSQEFYKLCQNMARLSQQIKELKKELNTVSDINLRQCESQLNMYYDRCDRFADALDEIETKGYSIDNLMSQYNLLIASIEDYQDFLDDFSSPLAA